MLAWSKACWKGKKLQLGGDFMEWSEFRLLVDYVLAVQKVFSFILAWRNDKSISMYFCINVWTNTNHWFSHFVLVDFPLDKLHKCCHWTRWLLKPHSRNTSADPFNPCFHPTQWLHSRTIPHVRRVCYYVTKCSLSIACLIMKKIDNFVWAAFCCRLGSWGGKIVAKR